MAADGSSHHADRLLAEALDAMVYVVGGEPSSQIAIAVPAHWGPATWRALSAALRTNPTLVSDCSWGVDRATNADRAVWAPAVWSRWWILGVAAPALFADAASAFEPIAETSRYPEFYGDQIDQALFHHVLDGICSAGRVDPAGTAAVGSLARLREECRIAKERLSAETVTELVAELPGYRSSIRVTRAELEQLISEPLGGVLATAGKPVGAQQDWLGRRFRAGNRGWRCQYSADHPTPLAAHPDAGGDHSAAGP